MYKARPNSNWGAAFLALSLLACAPEDHESAYETNAGSDSTSQGMVVGDEDWDDLDNHTPTLDSAYNPTGFSAWSEAHAIARIVTPVGHCSSFLIGKDLLMTARHCFLSGNGNGTYTFQPPDGNTTATFGLTKNLATGLVPAGSVWTCPIQVDTDAGRDINVVRC